MRPKVSFMLVGAFVIALSAALVVAVVWLSTASADKAYDTYVMYPPSVSGLNPNATVSYNGVEVGRVTEIELDRDDPSRVRVLLEVESGTPIKTDTVGVVAASGITGVAHISLSGGSAEAPLLEAT